MQELITTIKSVNRYLFFEVSLMTILVRYYRKVLLLPAERRGSEFITYYNAFVGIVVFTNASLHRKSKGKDPISQFAAFWKPMISLDTSIW